jgi:N-acetylglucosamine-6-phosphate deacetylase
MPGFLGLHLEGPHLDPRRKGAHDAGLIRPMEEGDLELLLAAAAELPALMVTLAPEAVSAAQIAALAAAGVIVSLGHSDTSEGAARAAIGAGASCVTHLYNAMSPLAHRAPGLVGAALDSAVRAGIIPDGVHVAPAAFRIALAMKPGRLFAVTDAMAVAGTEATEFTLNGRRILREGGRLTLTDGTLAGADVTLPQALRWMTAEAGVPVETALAMTTSVPAEVLGLSDRGALRAGCVADLVHLSDDFALHGVWRGGARLL